MLTHLIFAGLLGATLLGWAAADLVLYTTAGYEATFSYMMLTASRQMPIIPALIGFAAGVLFGHLFWPQ